MKRFVGLLPILLIGLMVLSTGCSKTKDMAPPYQVKEKAKKIMLLDEGVKLYMVHKGEGEMPTIDDRLKVHYHGMLADGTVFDSSFDRGESIVFPLKNLIKGWQIGLVEVPVGSKVRLVIPPAAAYGDRELPGIPPGSTLTFDIEIISIEK